MEPAKTFEDLIVWQKAHQFTLNVYSYTKEFSKGGIVWSYLSIPSCCYFSGRKYCRGV